MARSSAPLVLLQKRLGEAEWQRREPVVQAYLHAVLAKEPELSTTACSPSGTNRPKGGSRAAG